MKNKKVFLLTHLTDSPLCKMMLIAFTLMKLMTAIFYSLCNRCCPNHYSLQFRNHHHWKSCITFESKLSHSSRTKHTLQLWICKYSRIWIFNGQIWRIWYWKFYHFWPQFDKCRYIVMSEFLEDKEIDVQKT